MFGLDGNEVVRTGARSITAVAVAVRDTDPAGVAPDVSVLLVRPSTVAALIIVGHPLLGELQHHNANRRTCGMHMDQATFARTDYGRFR